MLYWQKVFNFAVGNKHGTLVFKLILQQQRKERQNNNMSKKNPAPKYQETIVSPVISMRSFWERPILLNIALVLAALLTWGTVLSNDFVFFDDDKAVLYNHALQNPSLSKFFSGQNLGMYAPLSWIGYWIGSLLSGKSAWGYHLLSVILHAINTLMVFAWLKGLSSRTAIAFFAAILFAVHPMQAEAVCWVAALSTVLFSSFYLGSLLAYLQFLSKKSHGWLALSLLLFLFACWSKSAAVTLPLLLLVMDYYWVQKNKGNTIVPSIDFKTAIAYKIPFMLLSIYFGLHTFTTRAQEGHDIEQSSAVFSLLDRFFMVCQTLLFYPVKLLLPLGYSVAYPFVKMDGAWPFYYYAAPLALLALAYLIWKKWRDQPDYFLGVALYFLPLTVMLPFRTVGSFELRSDRYVYISCIGLFFITGLLLEKVKSPLRMGIVTALVVGLATLSFFQVSVWKNGVNLFKNCVAKTPESSLCQCNLAYNELLKFNFPAAIEHYSEALKYDATVIEAYNGRGQAYLQQKKIREAFDDFDKAIKGGLSSPKLFLNRGKCLVMLNRVQEAVPDLEKSLELEPKSPEAWYLLGITSDKRDDRALAIEQYSKAIALNPNYLEAIANRGVLYLDEKKLKESIADFDKAISINPGLAMLFSNRANARFQLGEYDKAIADATKALDIDDRYLPSLQIRGNAYLRVGQTAKGQADIKKADDLMKK